MDKLPSILGGSPSLNRSQIEKWPRPVGIRTIKKINQILEAGKFAMGKETENFEKDFANYCGAKFSILVTSGSEALSQALHALSISKGDEVIIPALGFISNLSTVIISGAKPILADIDPLTSNISPKSVKKLITEKTKAIVLIAYGGTPYDIHEFRQLIEGKAIYLIEDASHAHGGEIRGKKIGTYGHIGCFSFDQNKLMTSGQGGAIVTNNEKIFEDLKIRRNFGLDRKNSIPQWLYFPVISSNCKPTDITALMLSEQLDRLENDIKIRKNNFDKLTENLCSVPGLKVISPGDFPNRESHYLMRFEFNATHWNEISRDLLIKSMLEEGIPIGPGWAPLYYRFGEYRDSINMLSLNQWEKKLPNSSKFSRRQLVLPNELLLSSDSVIDATIGAFKKVFSSSKKIKKAFPNFSTDMIKNQKNDSLKIGLEWLRGN